MLNESVAAGHLSDRFQSQNDMERKMAKKNGTAENDIINGTQGNDTLNGNGGDVMDTLADDGDGNDTLTGGAGADMFTFDTSDGVNTITDFSVAERDKIIISRDDYEGMMDEQLVIKVSIADNWDHTDILYDSRVVMTLNDIDHADVIENFDSYFEIW